MARRWLRDERDLGLVMFFAAFESCIVSLFRLHFAAVFERERLRDTSVMFIRDFGCINILYGSYFYYYCKCCGLFYSTWFELLLRIRLFDCL